MARITKWDKEIIAGLIAKKEPSEGKELSERYKELRKKGMHPEEILDYMSGQTADTRWIWWLPSARKIKKVL